MNVAIIPARGNSKRIPRKNIKPFVGKPMIEYSIGAALTSGLFERVIVSTDAPDIADVAVRAGAVVPALRPADLAGDFVATAPVLVHALRELVPAAGNYEFACCILATAPFLEPRYLAEGFDAIKTLRCDSVISVTSFEYPILRALTLNDRGRLDWVWPEHELTRSNDLPEALHDAGQFYWLDVERFLRTERILGTDAAAVRLPRCAVQDIDTPEDWEYAERMYRLLAERQAPAGTAR